MAKGKIFRKVVGTISKSVAIRGGLLGIQAALKYGTLSARASGIGDLASRLSTLEGVGRKALPEGTYYSYDLEGTRKKIPTPEVSCEEEEKKVKIEMQKLMGQYPTSPASIAAGAAIGASQGLIQKEITPPEYKDISEFNPFEWMNDLPTEDSHRCYMETIERRPKKGYGRDRCAQLLNKPPNQGISNFSNTFLKSLKDQPTKVPVL